MVKRLYILLLYLPDLIEVDYTFQSKGRFLLELYTTDMKPTLIFYVPVISKGHLPTHSD
jgi:hypothetical protein